jgi:hypothetical protein
MSPNDEPLRGRFLIAVVSGLAEFRVGTFEAAIHRTTITPSHLRVGRRPEHHLYELRDSASPTPRTTRS